MLFTLIYFAALILLVLCGARLNFSIFALLRVSSVCSAVFVVRTAFDIYINILNLCCAVQFVCRCSLCTVHSAHRVCTSQTTTIQKSRARPFMSAVIILFVAIFIYFNSHYYICYVMLGLCFSTFLSVLFSCILCIACHAVAMAAAVAVVLLLPFVCCTRLARQPFVHK